MENKLPLIRDMILFLLTTENWQDQTQKKEKYQDCMSDFSHIEGLLIYPRVTEMKIWLMVQVRMGGK